MRKLLLLLLLFSVSAVAQTGAISNYCVRGAMQATTSGLNSSNYLQGVIPSCTVTVYLTGTTNLATIYFSQGGSPYTGPFTANTDGSWLFYAVVNQGYDVVLSGGVTPNTYPAPVPLVNQFPGGAGSILGGTVKCAPTYTSSNVLSGCAGVSTLLSTNQSLSGTLTDSYGFIGPLTGTVTGHASLDLLLTGGTLSGALTVPSITDNGLSSGIVTNVGGTLQSEGFGPSLASPTVISSASFLTTGLVMPTVPISTVSHGHCTITWEQAISAATISFGAGMDHAPIDLWIMSTINYTAAGATTVAYNTQTATTATIIGAAATPGSATTPYYANFDFVLQTGGTNTVTLTFYGLTSNTSDALVIEPGSYCSWLP